MTHTRENRVVELAGFATAAEAEVTASMLRSMGVEVSVVNEISSIMLPYINDNRVRLLVNEADLDRAKELLAATPEEWWENGKWKQMRVSECRDCLQAMPSESILEQAKLGQLKIISLVLKLPKLLKFPKLSGIKKDTREEGGSLQSRRY